MGKNYVNKKPKEERPEGDFYPTPISLLWELLKVEDIDSNDILEPACGAGNLSKELKKNKFKVKAFDLYRDGQDFLKYNKSHNTILTNVPFSQFDDFIFHAKEINIKKIITIAKLNFFGAYQRNDKGLWKELKYVRIFDRQVDYRTPYRKDGNFHVGNLVTGWFIWEKGYRGKTKLEMMPVNKYATLGQYKK